MKDKIYDVLIIGAGITGAAIARRLSMYRLDIALVDEASDIAMGASRANSAIVHAGYDCPVGSVEARLNVRGNELFTSWCEELEVPLIRCGSLVVAFGEGDEAELVKLYERGLAAGVPGMSIISGDEARLMEPALSGDVTAALLAETGGITCPYQMAIACCENARDNGAEWVLGFPVTDIVKDANYLRVLSGERELKARYVINAAGVFADDVARMVGDDSFSIRPRKGEYLLLDHQAKAVNMVVFQTPSALGKGILVSPTVDDNCFAGPTAVDQQDKRDTEVTKEGIEQLTKMAKRSVPGLDTRQVITSFAGVRAQPSTGDFIIRQSDVEPRMIHAAGICSPGLTSAPAIAEEIEGIMRGARLELVPRENAVKTRLAIPEFRRMTERQRADAISENPLYGRVICRCETITEAEIVEAVRRGARTIDGVKRRTRAGMGRCQGGFCGPRVMDIISRECGIPLDAVTKSGGGSWMVEAMSDEK